jgi:hypothetical protein
MHPTGLAALPLCLVLLLGCGPEPPVVGGPRAQGDLLQTVGPADPCGAGRLQGLVGQDAAQANVAALPEMSRVLYPDMGDGGPFMQQRVTIRVSNANTITSVGCG